MNLKQRVEDQLNIDKFEEWLKEKPSTTVVGEPRCWAECPLANYLSETLNIKAGVDGEEACCVDLDTHEHEDVYLPDWAEVFVDKIDKEETGIEANKALKILNREQNV